MIRAIFFDFYGVWTPDTFSEYLGLAQQMGPKVAGELEYIVNQYFHGQVNAKYVADAFRFKLSRPDIDSSQFTLSEEAVFPAIVEFMRNLHGHFVKLGILANLGVQEYQLLTSFNTHNQLFEVIAGPLPLQMQEPLLSNEVFARALQAIGEPPRSCLVVSANLAYLGFAQSLGIATLAYEGFPKLRETLDQLLSSEAAQ
jgi:FMN phosphatase YigB (HAD superfamily)